jgi:hypothetical protein
MAVVRLGNRAALYKDEVIPGDFVTEITVHDDVDAHHDQVRNITHVDGLWPRFSAEPATWVSCEELPRLELALSAHFDCPIIPHEHAMGFVADAYAAPPAVPPTGEPTNRDEISPTVSHAGEDEVL